MTLEGFRIAFSQAVAEDDVPLCETVNDGIGDYSELSNAGLDKLTNIAETVAEPLFNRIAELRAALWAILRWDIDNVIPDALFKQAKAAVDKVE